MPEARKNPLFTGRQLYMLIWPLVVEQLLNVLVGMVDVVMVTSIGEAAVSGVSLVDSVCQLIIAFLAALTAGGTVVCSQFLGMQDPRRAQMSAGQVVSVTVAGTAALSALLLAGGKGLLGVIFGTVEAEVMENAVLYLRITACSFPFLALYNSSAALYRATGNSRISMKTSILMNGVNVVGNAVCIYGLHMGVAGAAIPTLLARSLAAVVLFRLLQDPGNALRVGGMADLKFNWGIIRRILAIGIPGGVESGIFQLGKLMLQSLVSTLGTAAIAGYAVAGNLVMFLYLPGNALGLAATTVVSRCVGAREAEQAWHYTWLLVLLNYAFLAVVATGMALGRQFFVGIYSLSPEAAEAAQQLVLSHSLAMVIWPLAFTTPHALRAANDARFTMVVSIGCMWLFRVGLAYFFVRTLGRSILYVWYAMYIDWVVRVFIYCLRLRTFRQRINSLTL